MAAFSISGWIHIRVCDRNLWFWGGFGRLDGVVSGNHLSYDWWFASELGSGLSPWSHNLDSVGEPYPGDAFRQRFKPSRRRRRPLAIAPKNRSILQDCGRHRCVRPCKILGLNRTKTFHVKHFGTIAVAGCEPRLVGLTWAANLIENFVALRLDMRLAIHLQPQLR
jgi:hypothetical protein